MARRVVEIPADALVLLVGASGAGKTTFAARHFPAECVLSSDALRAAVSGDPADQRATRPAFARLHRMAGSRLAAGRLTVVDATNVRQGARAALLRIARSAGRPTIALVFDLPDEIALARNATRPGRIVPATAVRRQLADLRASLATPGGLAGEGFAAVIRLADPDPLERTLVRLLPGPPSATLAPTGSRKALR